MRSEPFNPSKDIPSLKDKVFLITGGTSGLGKETILALARSEPSRIYFTGRNSTAAANVISEAEAESAARNPSLKLTFLECDHTSFPSVENAIRQFLSETQRLDVLLCNAGVMGTDPSLTRDGYENQFGINQMAHTLMIKMLLPILQSTAQMTGDVRVVFESSIGFRWTPSGVFVYLATLGQSISAKEGAHTPCWAMTTSKAGLSNGAFYEKVGVAGSPSKDSSNEDLGKKLWTWTQAELEKHGV